MKFVAGKHYKTRSGDRVRIYGTDCSPDFPIHGAVYEDGYWDTFITWMADGTINGPDHENSLDLIDEWPSDAMQDLVDVTELLGLYDDEQQESPHPLYPRY